LMWRDGKQDFRCSTMKLSRKRFVAREVSRPHYFDEPEEEER